MTTKTVQSNVTEVLARFAATVTYDEIPERARESCKNLLLDALACAVAGHQGEETHQIAALASGLAQSNESSIIGGDRLSLTGATLLNGFLITAITMCDIHRSTLTHVTTGSGPTRSGHCGAGFAVGAGPAGRPRRRLRDDDANRDWYRLSGISRAGFPWPRAFSVPSAPLRPSVACSASTPRPWQPPLAWRAARPRAPLPHGERRRSSFTSVAAPSPASWPRCSPSSNLWPPASS